MKLRDLAAAVAVGVLPAAAACAPPHGQLTCDLFISKPATTAAGKDRVTWGPVHDGGLTLNEWLAHCDGRFRIVKTGPPAPDGTVTFDVLLSIADCTGLAPIGLADLWQAAHIVPRFV